MRFLSVGPRICLQLPSDSTSRWTPLLFSYTFPTTWACSGLSPARARPWRANETCAARRTTKITAVATTFHGSHGCFSITILFPKYALRYLPASSPVPDSPLPAQQVPAYSPLPDMPVLPHSERASYHPARTPSAHTPAAHD